MSLVIYVTLFAKVIAEKRNITVQGIISTSFFHVKEREQKNQEKGKQKEINILNFFWKVRSETENIDLLYDLVGRAPSFTVKTMNFNKLLNRKFHIRRIKLQVKKLDFKFAAN